MNKGFVLGRISGIKTGSFQSQGEDVTKLSFFVNARKVIKGEDKGITPVEIICHGQMAEDWIEKLAEDLQVNVEYRAESRENGNNRYSDLKAVGIEIIW
ncbi:MAG: hypothetical protein ACYC63_20660 [Armatimonadota bacterium]